MTENKRFTIKEIDNFNYGIKVTDVIMDDGIELPQSTVCDLLNGLSDENEQLRKEIERKEKIIQDKSELVRQQVNVSENLQARINILERALEEEE